MYRALQDALATRLTDFGWARRNRGHHLQTPAGDPGSKLQQGNRKVGVRPLQTEKPSSDARMDSENETEVRRDGNGSGNTHHR